MEDIFGRPVTRTYSRVGKRNKTKSATCNNEQKTESNIKALKQEKENNQDVPKRKCNKQIKPQKKSTEKYDQTFALKISMVEDVQGDDPLLNDTLFGEYNPVQTDTTKATVSKARTKRSRQKKPSTNAKSSDNKITTTTLPNNSNEVSHKKTKSPATDVTVEKDSISRNKTSLSSKIMRSLECHVGSAENTVRALTLANLSRKEVTPVADPNEKVSKWLVSSTPPPEGGSDLVSDPLTDRNEMVSKWLASSTPPPEGDIDLGRDPLHDSSIELMRGEEYVKAHSRQAKLFPDNFHDNLARMIAAQPQGPALKNEKLLREKKNEFLSDLRQAMYIDTKKSIVTGDSYGRGSNRGSTNEITGVETMESCNQVSEVTSDFVCSRLPYTYTSTNPPSAVGLSSGLSQATTGLTLGFTPTTVNTETATCEMTSAYTETEQGTGITSKMTATLSKETGLTLGTAECTGTPQSCSNQMASSNATGVTREKDYTPKTPVFQMKAGIGCSTNMELNGNQDHQNAQNFVDGHKKNKQLSSSSIEYHNRKKYFTSTMRRSASTSASFPEGLSSIQHTDSQKKRAEQEVTPMKNSQFKIPGSPSKAVKHAHRQGHLKQTCSTQLFTTGFVEIVDVIPPISAITSELASKTAEKDDQTIEQGVDRFGRVKTSTPNKAVTKKQNNYFEFDLSSVKLGSDEDDLLHFNTSGHSVNSDEIVALSQSYIDLKEGQILPKSSDFKSEAQSGSTSQHSKRKINDDAKSSAIHIASKTRKLPQENKRKPPKAVAVIKPQPKVLLRKTKSQLNREQLYYNRQKMKEQSARKRKNSSSEMETPCKGDSICIPAVCSLMNKSFVCKNLGVSEKKWVDTVSRPYAEILRSTPIDDLT